MRPKQTELGAFGAVVRIAGRCHARREQAEAQEQVVVQSAQSQQATQEQIDGFKKAFSACMEGKSYIAKF